MSISEKMNLEGRTALVTGAAGHLGSVITKVLAELGASLILVDRPGVYWEKLKTEMESNGKGAVLFIECDLELEDQRITLIKDIFLRGCGLDILVNNAAFVGSSELSGWATDFERQSLDTWRRAFEVNLTAAFHLSQGLFPIFKEQGRGVILNIGSIYGEYGPDWSLYEDTGMANPAAYAASKGGLLQLTRWLATTLAPFVRVNAINPGGIYRQQPQNFIDRYCAKVPLGRMATEEDFCGAIALLTTDMSEYITGEVLSISGGWGVW